MGKSTSHALVQSVREIQGCAMHCDALGEGPWSDKAPSRSSGNPSCTGGTDLSARLMFDPKHPSVLLWTKAWCSP